MEYSNAVILAELISVQKFDYSIFLADFYAEIALSKLRILNDFMLTSDFINLNLWQHDFESRFKS